MHSVCLYQAIGGVALFAAGLLGGVLGHLFTLRSTFWLTIPVITKDTLNAVFRNRSLIFILITMSAVSLANGLLGEMNQLWYIALAAPVIFFGLAGSVINATWGFGGLLARFFTTRRTVVACLVTVLIMALGLVFARSSIVVLITLFVFMMLANALTTALTGQMHRQLPSRVRAGAGSAVNTVMRLVNIPLVLGFGWVAHNSSIFTAAWILVVLILIAIASELGSHFRSRPSTIAT